MKEIKSKIVWHCAKEVLPAQRGMLLVCQGGKVYGALLDKEQFLWIENNPDEGIDIWHADIEAWAYWPECPKEFDKPTKEQLAKLETLRNQ